jgi:4-hydroxybenzoate polyprenyltransferase
MSRVRGYVELIRPANVTTALADVLAGYAVAGLGNHGALPWLLLSTACLYAGGIVLNDFFDCDIDRLERPERPIPRGAVTPTAAARFGGALLVAGILVATRATSAAALVALTTAGFIILYDAWGKRQPIGPVNMGICRALNLLLGVAASPPRLASYWYLALLPLVYISAVTAVSRGEVHGGRREVAGAALISLSLVLSALAGLALARGNPSLTGLLWTILLAWMVVPAFWAVYKTPGPQPIRQAVKAGVLSLVLLDAAIGAIYGGALYSALILVAGVIARRLATVFSVT